MEDVKSPEPIDEPADEPTDEPIDEPTDKPTGGLENNEVADAALSDLL